MDADNADAQAALGAVLFLSDWNWVGAERSLRRALALNPSHTEASLLYGRLLEALGRLQDGLELKLKALERDPFSPAVHLQISLLYGPSAAMTTRSSGRARRWPSIRIICSHANTSRRRTGRRVTSIGTWLRPSVTRNHMASRASCSNRSKRSTLPAAASAWSGTRWSQRRAEVRSCPRCNWHCCMAKRATWIRRSITSTERSRRGIHRLFTSRSRRNGTACERIRGLHAASREWVCRQRAGANGGPPGVSDLTSRRGEAPSSASSS